MLCVEATCRIPGFYSLFYGYKIIVGKTEIDLYFELDLGNRVVEVFCLKVELFADLQEQMVVFVVFRR